MKNTQYRQETKLEFEKNLFKLMNNAVFGKTMENVFKRCKYIPSAKGKILKNCVFYEEYGEIDIMIENKIPVLDKPMYIGFAILEISKYHMYDIYINCISKAWPKHTLYYMDTDSFIVGVEHEGKFNYPEDYKHWFDLGSYDKEDVKYDVANKGVIGKMKDEYPNDEIKEIVAIRSKCYGLRFKSKEMIKIKGVKVDEQLNFNDMVNVIMNNEGKYVNQVGIKSNKHEINTLYNRKLALNTSMDIKRQDDIKDKINSYNIGI